MSFLNIYNKKVIQVLGKIPIEIVFIWYFLLWLHKMKNVV